MVRNSVLIDKKRKAIKLVKEGKPKKQIARELDVSSKQIRDWYKKKEEIEEADKSKKTLHKGPAFLDKEHISNLLGFVETKRSDDLALNHGLVTHELLRYKPEISTPGTPLFKKVFKVNKQRVRRILRSKG